MPHENHAWNIYDALRDVLQSNIKQITVENVANFPEAEEQRQAYLGKFRRAALFRLDSDEFNEEASDDYNSHFYFFDVQLFVIDPSENQQGLMDFVEECKYYFQQHKTSEIYIHIRTVDVEYLDVGDSNIKAAELRVRVHHGG